MVVRNRFFQALCLVTALLLGMVPSLQAGTIFGTVYTRAPVLNPNTGAQIWSEYHPETGEIILDIADAVDTYDPAHAIVISAQQYRSYTNALTVLQETFRDPDTNITPTLVYTRDAYQSTDFRTLEDEVIAKPALRSSTTHVAIRPESLRYLNNPDELILEEYPADPEFPVSDSAFSLLVDKNGAPLYTSRNRIGIKAAFLSDASNNVIPPEGRRKRTYDDTVHGPVPYVMIEGPMNSRTGSVADGSFVLAWYDIPCPLVSYTHDGWAVARFLSRRFNPKSNASPAPYFLVKPYSVGCLPQTFIVPFLGPMPIGLGEFWAEPKVTDFVVDTMALSGTAHMARLDQSMIEIGDRTRYVSEDLTLERTLSATDDSEEIFKQGYYDFDGDEINDTVAKGYWREEPGPDGEPVLVFDTETVDSVDESRHLQGVYLSGGTQVPGEDSPDFTRALDWQTNFHHEGMVDAIGVDDLKDTDLYVFRLTDGKLISERLGLASEDGNWSEELGVAEQDSRFFYHNYLRGYWGDVGRLTGGRVANFNQYQDWQATSGINPELHERQADHLKPGDRIELVAINRATGYMGTVQTTMQPAGESGYLSWDMDEIKLQPPELKVWVERDYDIKAGLEKGEIREDQIISYEGAALSSDRAVVVYTDWRKADGSSLPLMEDGDEADYGYTGRITYLSGDNQIAPEGSYGIAQFAIKPGKHMQVLKLPTGQAANQHLYIQVSGEPESGRPVFSNYNQSKTADFSSTGVHDGKLKPRPDRFVPFKVPVFDEVATEEQRQIYRKLKREDPENDYTRPEPVYRWVYRPDFQYSVYGLDLKELTLLEDPADPAADLLAKTSPLIGSGDDLISLMYDLKITEYLPVDFFNTGEEKELIFTFGEEEVRAKINEQNKIEFTNLEHLASLDPEDYLTIQLYTNNDAGNVLWDYAFDYLSIYAPNDSEMNEEIGDYYFLSADEPVVELEASLLSYLVSDKLLEDREDVTLKWSVEGAGATATPLRQTNKTGIFRTEITVPPSAGSRIKVSATILGSDESVSFPEIVVVPGLPHEVSVNVANSAFTRGVGELHSTIQVKDQSGNPVRGGTPVGISIQGDGYSEARDLLVDDSGVATVSLKGGNFPGPANTIFAQSLSAKSSATFSISDMETALTGIPATVDANSVHKVVVKALAGGQPAVGAPIDVSVDFGNLHVHNTRTNSNGEILITWRSGSTPGQATFRACTDGAGCSTSTTVDIVELNPSNSTNVVAQSLLVGDQLNDGLITHQRYDGTNVNLAYSVESDLSLEGTDSGVQAVTLGSLWHPNRSPVLDWPMNEVIGRQLVTSGGNRAALIKNVAISQHIGEEVPRAYRFDGTATIDLAEREDIKSNQLGFRLRLKPTAFGGEVLNLGDAHRLILLENGSLRYTVKTTTAEYHAQTSPLQLNKWHRVAARFVDGQLELVLDDQDKVIVPVEGLPDYSAPGLPDDDVLSPGLSDSKVLVLGHSYVGHMAHFLVYNPQTEPLVFFASSNNESSNVTFDGDGQSSTRIRASGNLLPDVSQSISVTVNNTSIGSLDLMGTDVVRRSLAVYASIYSDAPQLPELRRIHKNAMEAGKQSYIAQQMVGATLDTAIFETSDSVMASLAALEFLPHRESFENHILKLQKLFHETGNTAAFRAASDSIGIRVKQSLLGNHEGLDRIQLALLVWGEMIDENPAAARFVAESVNSQEDFDTWVRFFSLPATGWIGFEPPVPGLTSDCAQDVPVMDVGAGIKLPLVTCRLNGQTVAHIVQGFIDDNEEVALAPGTLPPLLNVILNELPHADMFFRRYFLSSEGINQVVQGDTYGLIPDAHAAAPAVVAAAALRLMVRVGVKVTVGAVKNIAAFVMGKTNSRLSPVAIIAAMAYLETRMQDNCGGCTKLPEELHQKIHNLEKLFFINMAYKGRATDETAEKEFSCKVWNGTQGKQFEVAMVAYFHAMHEFMKIEQFEVVDIQRNLPVKLLDPETGNVLSSFRRDYDIVLAGDDRSLPIIVEVKSAQARYTRDNTFNQTGFEKRFPRWSVARTNRHTGNATKTTVHRQLLLDAIASVEVAIPGSDPQRHASDYVWVWQDWAEPRDKRIEKHRDPGVSIWRQKVTTGEWAGDYLRERLSVIGSDWRAKAIVQGTLGVTSPNHLLRLSERVPAIGLQRFGKLDWRSMIETPQEGGSLKDQFYAQLDEDTRSVLRQVEEAERKITSIGQHIDDAAEYIRGKLDGWIGKPEWLEEAERTLRELEESKDRIVDEIDNRTLEYILPDDIVNACL